MHKYFADWYRAAGLDPKAEELEKRWQALEAFSKKIKIQNALDLVRLFYARPPQSPDFLERYSAAFHTVDPTFSTRNSELELRVLSGVTIAHIVETTRTSVTDAVALAMLCGSFKGLRQKILNSEIVESARTYLANESVRVRQVIKSFEVKAPDADLEELLSALTAAAAGNNLATIKEPLIPPFEKLSEAISDLTASINKMAEQLNNVISVRREESDILWWVFGEYSRDLKIPISGLSLPFAALVSGKELADIVSVIPAPLAAEAFLSKMLSFVNGGESSVTSIKDAVNAASKDWSAHLIQDRAASDLDDFCPVHFALEKSLGSSGSTGWFTIFDRATALKSRASMSPLDLAMQICDERMLMRAVTAAS